GRRVGGRKPPGHAAFQAADHTEDRSGPVRPAAGGGYRVRPDPQAVVNKLHSFDNAKIIEALHQGSWPSVEGNLSWNDIGEPQGQDLLLEWVNGKLLPVYPPEIALASPVIPKPNWGA